MFKALSTEKQSLLEADNKGLKDLAAWQEKNGKLTLQNAQLADELKKYRDMDLRLTECLDELTKKDSLVNYFPEIYLLHSFEITGFVMCNSEEKNESHYHSQFG